MAWKVEFDPRALRELEKLDRVAQRRIAYFLQNRVLGRNNPHDLGKALIGDKIGLWRYRVGDYRLICRVDNASGIVLVLRVAHRKQAYR